MTTAPVLTADDLDVAVRLRTLVTRLNRKLRQQALGSVSPAQASLLAMTDRLGSPTLGELARAEQIQPPTTTRLVGTMVEAGLLNKMVLDGRAVYEHDYGYPQHDHLHCTSCQSLIEFSSDELVRIRDAVAAQHQFRAQSHRLIISGMCAQCRGTRSKSRHQDRV